MRRDFGPDTGRAATYLCRGLLLITLDLVPNAVHLFDTHTAQLATARHDRLLHRGEAPDELVVGPPEGFFGVDAHPLGEDHQREEEIAHLFRAALLTLLGLQFGKLFTHFVEDALDIGPI